ncbi:hypothetical protein [Corallococcus carmarthensis]|uniref:Uncharacterized protein n=1 Tax=Corallococcus carmarthensis TaxID=2316728 RepID=A0A3A8JFE1_9BACT|nr:hypothetical protein [Corallococcus carmarthensis]NOK20354.1 hypothetical protein [Corallococcus carmarthensis]RKG93718.1 hypothetical protein D7X32_43520 [Corallococcus carmarthensis]
MGSNTINRTPSSAPTARTTGPTQANPAASNQAMRELNTFSTQLKQQAAAPAPQQQAAAKKTSSADAQATGRQAVTDLAQQYTAILNESSSKRAVDTAQAKVDAFVAANPNATPEQIQAEAKKALNNASSGEYIFSSIINKSMNDIMAKVQERIDEQK